MNKKRGKGGLTHVSSLLPGLGIDVPDAPPALPEVPAYQPKPVSKRRQNRDERITKVRTDRDDSKQDVGYLPKGFVLCGLPFKPVKNATYYERSNGWKPSRPSVHAKSVSKPDLRSSMRSGCQNPVTVIGGCKSVSCVCFTPRISMARPGREG